MVTFRYSSGTPLMIERNVPSIFRNTPMFNMPPVATRTPVKTRKRRL